jgi:hypothetical protein
MFTNTSPRLGLQKLDQLSRCPGRSRWNRVRGCRSTEGKNALGKLVESQDLGLHSIELREYLLGSAVRRSGACGHGTGREGKDFPEAVANGCGLHPEGIERVAHLVHHSLHQSTELGEMETARFGQA